MNVFGKLTTVVGLALLSPLAQATSTPAPPVQGSTFSFLSSPVTPEAFGNSYSATINDLTLTTTAWSTTGSGGKFQTAELEIYTGYGMGVCSRSEGVNCSNSGNMHALDNKGADDLILFTFSNAVKLGSLSLLQFGGDSDLSLWAGTGSLNLNGMTPSNLGAATLVNNSNNANSTRMINLGSVLNGQYDWLAVAACIGQDNDFTKLRALTIAQPVPEAETWAMMLVGLGLVGFFAARRKA